MSDKNYKTTKKKLKETSNPLFLATTRHMGGKQGRRDPYSQCTNAVGKKCEETYGATALGDHTTGRRPLLSLLHPEHPRHGIGFAGVNLQLGRHNRGRVPAPMVDEVRVVLVAGRLRDAQWRSTAGRATGASDSGRITATSALPTGRLCGRRGRNAQPVGAAVTAPVRRPVHGRRRDDGVLPQLGRIFRHAAERTVVAGATAAATTASSCSSLVRGRRSVAAERPVANAVATTDRGQHRRVDQRQADLLERVHRAEAALVLRRAGYHHLLDPLDVRTVPVGRIVMMVPVPIEATVARGAAAAAATTAATSTSTSATTCSATVYSILMLQQMMMVVMMVRM